MAGAGDLVWDDTPTVLANLYTAPSGPVISFADPNFLQNLWEQDFGAVHVDGYRPLSWAVRRIGLSFQASSEWAPAGFVALNAVLAGLLAVALFWLARRFTRHHGRRPFQRLPGPGFHPHPHWLSGTLHWHSGACAVGGLRRSQLLLRLSGK